MYVIATDPGTITTIQRVGFAFWEPGLFQNGCLTKHGAKWAEVVQKFVPRSRVGIFRNECTRSTPLDPKLTFSVFCTIWVDWGPFGCLTELGAKRAELV